MRAKTEIVTAASECFYILIWPANTKYIDAPFLIE